MVREMVREIGEADYLRLYWLGYRVAGTVMVAPLQGGRAFGQLHRTATGWCWVFGGRNDSDIHHDWTVVASDATDTLDEALAALDEAVALTEGAPLRMAA